MLAQDFPPHLTRTWLYYEYRAATLCLDLQNLTPFRVPASAFATPPAIDVLRFAVLLVLATVLLSVPDVRVLRSCASFIRRAPFCTSTTRRTERAVPVAA